MKNFTFILFVFFSTLLPYISNGQVIVCENASCTANDYNLDNFYLGDASGSPFDAGYCEPGEPVVAHIWTNFSANSNANRYTLYMHYNLYIDGVFIDTVDECYYEGLPIPTDVSLDIYDFSWTCGSVIELRDFYMSWQPNSHSPCGCSNAKCFSAASIIVEGPLIANFEFNPSCESAYTLDFTSTTTGGNPPYSYLWDFGDGTTSTLASPSHSYDSTGPYSVVLTVYDSDNFDYHEIEIVDFDPNLPPEIFAPPNENIEGCDETVLSDLPVSLIPQEITVPQFYNVGGSFILSSAIVSLTYVDIVANTCPTTITRTFTVIDSCDHSALDTQVIVINDTTLPTASNPATLTVQCASDIPVADINVVNDVNDNCAGTIVAFVSDVSNGNTCPEIITRTYSVTDPCGNSIDVTQSIIINDDIAPTASNPAPISVQCMADVPVANINDVTDEADNCSTPSVAFISDVTSSGSCPITITRTYSVIDDCNNSIIVTQIITVNDTIPPTASTPTDISVECSSLIPAADPLIITDEADNCSTPIVAFVSDVSNTGSCPEVITRTYSVTDNCGNETLLTQNITIEDTTAPTASTPAPINVQCIADVPAPDITLISDAVDNCSNPIVSFISDVSTGQCPQIIIRTYQVEDGCGNTIDLIQNINVIDTTPPTASNPADIMINCSDPIPVPDTSLVIDAADNCSAPIVAFVEDLSNGACPEVITRTYSVTDECGNTINVSHDIISEDVDAPTLSGPLNDATVDCNAIPAVANLTFIDNCSTNVSTVFTEINTYANDPVSYTITRTWTVTDECGNSDTFTQVLTVDNTDCYIPVCASDCGATSDTTPPTASILGPLDVACESDIPAPDINVVIGEMDNCSATVTVAFVGETVYPGCFEKIIRTYSVTDKCGNEILLERRISVVDIDPPTASNPAPMIVSCSSAIPEPDTSVVTDAADNCSTPVVVAFVSDVSNNACNQRIIRTYSVTDGCGNSINVTQDINVIDNIPPTASAPSPIHVECISDVPIPDENVITDEADNCSIPTVSFISDISDNNICPETITRTYRITDECGNFDDVEQLIIVHDFTDPTASDPLPITVNCIGDVPVWDVSVVTDEADNCSIAIVAFVDDVSDNLSCPETITRTYSVTDLCGNSIEVYQSIIVHDLIPPTASNPATVQVSNIASVPAFDVNVVTDEADNCAVPTVTYINDVSDNLTCPETITRTYRVTDDCGNFINVTQTIVVLDDVNPTAIAPSPTTVQCIGDVPAFDITSVITSDNASTPIVTFVSDVSDNQTCPETITRTYNVADDCGNSIQVSHIIIVDDDTPPTASDPVSIEIYDTANIPNPDVNVVIDEADNCAIPIVALISEVSNNDTCQLIITRTYSVTDDCGNSINVSHDIIVYDTEAPTATAPQDLYFSCSDTIPDPDINIITDASDNYSSVTINFINEVTNEEICPEILTRTYRIIDECGNYIDVSHDIIINDDVNPTASNPLDIIVSQLSEVPAVNPEVVTDEADNCSIPIVEFVSETSDNQTCPETITRIYSVTDPCGNSINVSHNIIVNDTENPVANNLTNLTLSCVSEVPAPDSSIVIATDNVSIPSATFISDVSDNNVCPETITRTYRVTDDCGNTIDVTQLFTINDDIAPTASNPQTLQFNCLDEVPSPNINVVTDASDNCSTPSIAFVSEASDNQTCPETITRIYSVTDLCGNSINVSQAIEVFDTIAPTASNPQNIIVNQFSDVPAVDTEIVTDEADNCSIPIVAFVSENTITNTCENIITRIYSVTDACGNSINVSHNIIVNDTEPPVFDANRLVPLALSCSTQIPEPDPSIIIASDNTSAATITFISDISDNNTCPEIITRTYRISDECGNAVDATQLITINDNIAPTASDLQTIIVDCIDNVPSPDIASVTDATDNCSNPTITFVSDTQVDFKCGGSIIRIYNVADDCGNSIDISQIINIEDNEPPTLISNLDIESTVYCGVIPEIPNVEFSDNCSATVHVNYHEEIVTLNSNDDSNNSYDINRTWSATDECGNTLHITQTTHMIVEIEILTENISLCIDEDYINLEDLVDLDDNGIWESEYMHVLDNMEFNPYLIPEGDYFFSYTVQNNECLYYKEIFINVNDDCIEYPCIKSINDVNISILVTPNDDFKNETFDVSYILNPAVDDEFACDIKTVVKIFNRWGTKVYQSNDYANNWKGESPSGSIGLSDKLPAGTYYYVVNLVNSGIKPIQGYILLGTENR